MPSSSAARKTSSSESRMSMATPSLESWHNVERGTYTHLGLPNRVENRPMPAVKLVDLRHEPKGHGKVAAVGPTLEAAMAGQHLDGSLPDIVEEVHLQHLAPLDDIRSSSVYRHAAAKQLVRELLQSLAAPQLVEAA